MIAEIRLMRFGDDLTQRHGHWGTTDVHGAISLTLKKTSGIGQNVWRSRLLGFTVSVKYASVIVPPEFGLNRRTMDPVCVKEILDTASDIHIIVFWSNYDVYRGDRFRIRQLPHVELV